MNAIEWPEGFVPGFTDNFVANEMIVSGLSVNEVWPLLSHPFMWPSYYKNAADVRFYDDKGPELEDGVRFHFSTFGFPIEAQVVEFVPPVAGQPARLAWHGASGAENTSQRLDVHHAWLVEDLPGNRVRILTQETQNGNPAQALANTRPNPMLNGHQEWLDGLIEAVRKQ